METACKEEDPSDDEIYFGKITIKEIKKMFCNRLPGTNKTLQGDSSINNDCNNSLRLIVTHSQPDLRCETDSPISYQSSPADDRNSDESFIKMENVVSKLCLSPRNESVELNNTLDVIDYILNHGANLNAQDPEKKPDIKDETSTKSSLLDKNNRKIPNVQVNGSPHEIKNEPFIKCDFEDEVSPKACLKIEHTPVQEIHVKESLVNGTPVKETLIKKTPVKKTLLKEILAKETLVKNTPVKKTLVKETPVKKTLAQETPVKNILVHETPVKNIHVQETPIKEILVQESPAKDPAMKSTNYYTPAKNRTKPNNLASPSSSTKFKTPLFKTPASSAQNKPPTPRNTPGTRTNVYGHIASPIATYIRQSPQVPLVKDVHPKKPLPGTSSIPKLVKNSDCKTQIVKNKENVNLPSVAYKSAKKTKVIHLPDVNRLPQSLWAKKMASSLPTIMKHENRKIKPLPSDLEDSLVNLSVHQAEVSLCTQKAAFKSTNKH